MKPIEYIPSAFEQVVLGYDETDKCVCSPNRPNSLGNFLKINMPDTIIFHTSTENFVPILPVCVTSLISVKRQWKYSDLSSKMIHVKNRNTDCEYTGEMVYVDKNMVDPTFYTPQVIDSDIIQVKTREVDAQKYSDDELNEGSFVEEYWNVNLLEYVELSIESGKYEVWVTYYGMESNHCVVEIITE